MEWMYLNPAVLIVTALSKPLFTSVIVPCVSCGTKEHEDASTFAFSRCTGKVVQMPDFINSRAKKFNDVLRTMSKTAKSQEPMMTIPNLRNVNQTRADVNSGCHCNIGSESFSCSIYLTVPISSTDYLLEIAAVRRKILRHETTEHFRLQTSSAGSRLKSRTASFPAM